MPLVLSESVSKLNARLKFCQTGSSPAYSNEELEAFIVDAVSEYSRFQPNKTMVELALLVNTQVYNWPNNVLKVEPFLFRLGDTPATVDSDYNDTFSSYFTHYFESPALQERNKTYLFNYFEAGQGAVMVDSVNRTLTIHPVPDEAGTVYLPVILSYEITGIDAAREYSAIPDLHINPILDMAQALAIRALSMGYAVNNKKIGDRDYRGKDIATQLLSEADRLEQRFCDFFYQPVVARS